MANQWNFGEVILDQGSKAQDRKLKIAIESARNKQFNDEMAMKKEYLKESIEARKAMDTFRAYKEFKADQRHDEEMTFKKGAYQSAVDKTTIDPNYLPTAEFGNIEEAGHLFRNTLGAIGTGGGALLGWGAGSVPLAITGGTYGYGLGTGLDLLLSGTSEKDYKAGLKQVDAFIDKAEEDLPHIMDKPKNLMMYDQKLQETLAMIQELRNNKENRSRIKRLNRLISTTGPASLLSVKQ